MSNTNVRCVTTVLCAAFQPKCVKRNNVRGVTTVKKFFCRKMAAKKILWDF